MVSVVAARAEQVGNGSEFFADVLAVLPDCVAVGDGLPGGLWLVFALALPPLSVGGRQGDFRAIFHDGGEAFAPLRVVFDVESQFHAVRL